MTETAAPAPHYRRVLLKLSGEALMGEDAYGINAATIEGMVRQVAGAVSMGVELARVLLKLSGEALMGEDAYGIN
ncbi:MAG: hypothetical protein O9972_61940, partial [Burkholderiales bacterium]|nr:hypothetical protein [Burkholderiales bacterium]